MVLYTPYDVALLMQDGEEQAFKEVVLENGITLLGRDIESGFKIERVISGNSNTFLLEQYQPGQVIKLS